MLRNFARHHQTGEPMPEALIKKLVAARTFNQGFATVEYLASALVDMKLHLAGSKEIDPDAFERDTLAATLRDLMQRYDALFGTPFPYSMGWHGAPSDGRLGLPDEELAGSHSSNAVVAWYSSHPDFLDLPVDLGCAAAAVVGVCNVADDVARILARDPEELAKTRPR